MHDRDRGPRAVRASLDRAPGRPAIGACATACTQAVGTSVRQAGAEQTQVQTCAGHGMPARGVRQHRRRRRQRFNPSEEADRARARAGERRVRRDAKAGAVRPSTWHGRRRRLGGRADLHRCEHLETRHLVTDADDEHAGADGRQLGSSALDLVAHQRVVATPWARLVTRGSGGDTWKLGRGGGWGDVRLGENEQTAPNVPTARP